MISPDFDLEPRSRAPISSVLTPPSTRPSRPPPQVSTHALAALCQAARRVSLNEAGAEQARPAVPPPAALPKPADGHLDVGNGGKGPTANGGSGSGSGGDSGSDSGSGRSGPPPRRTPPMLAGALDLQETGMDGGGGGGGIGGSAWQHEWRLGRPIVVAGVSERLRERWTPDRFSSQFGGLEVRCLPFAPRWRGSTLRACPPISAQLRRWTSLTSARRSNSPRS